MLVGSARLAQRLAVVLGVAHRDVASLIRGKPRPTEETTGTGAHAALDKAIADDDSAPGDLYAILYLLTEKPASVLVVEHDKTSGTSGDGQQALQYYADNYNKDDSKNSKSTGAHDKQKRKRPRKGTRMQLSRCCVLYTRLPLTTTRSVIRRGARSRRRTTALAGPLLY